MRYSKEKGFTLIEMMVTIFIYGLLLAGFTVVYVLLFQQSKYRTNALSDLDSVRRAGMLFTNELRNAQIGNDGSYPIGEASSTEVIFFSSFGSQSSTTVRRIRYYLSGGTLYKGIVTPSGSPLSYNLGSEAVTPVVAGIVSTSTPVFTYYDGTYAGTSSPLSQPVNTTQVTFTQMMLSILQQNSKTASTTYNFTSGAAIRTLKTNLGN